MDAMELRRRNLRLPWRDHAGAAANWLDRPRRHPTERARHRRRLPGHSVQSQTRAEGRSRMMRATMSNEVVCANCGERFTAPAHSGRYRQTSERRIKSARYCSRACRQAAYVARRAARADVPHSERHKAFRGRVTDVGAFRGRVTDAGGTTKSMRTDVVRGSIPSAWTVRARWSAYEGVHSTMVGL
jgi:hypothetical protein